MNINLKKISMTSCGLLRKKPTRTWLLTPYIREGYAADTVNSSSNFGKLTELVKKSGLKGLQAMIKTTVLSPVITCGILAVN